MATTLTTSWQTIATGTTKFTGTATHNLSIYIDARYTSQSTTSLTTAIEVRLQYAEDSSYTSDSNTSFTCSYCDAVSGYYTFTTSKQTATSGSATITHSSDGTKSLTLSATAELKGYAKVSISASGTVTLPTIDQAPYVTALSDFTVGDTVKATLYNPQSKSCTVSLIANGKTLSTTKSTSSTSVSGWNDSTSVSELYTALASVTSASYYFKVVWSSTTKSSSTATVSVGTDIVPDVGTITITETNSSVKSITTDSTVRYLSTKKVSVTPTAGTGSSVSTVAITYGDQTLTASASSGTYSASFSSLSSGSVSVKVTDKRSRSTTAKTSQTYYSYSYPTVAVTASRTSQTSSNGTATVTGKYFYNKTLGTTATVYFDRSSSASTKVSATLSSGSIKYSASYTDLTYSKSFNFSAKVTDSFGQSITAKFVLPVAKPTLWLGKDEVRAWRYLEVGASGDSADIGVGAKDESTGLELELKIDDDHQTHGIYSNGYVTDDNLSASTHKSSGKWLMRRTSDNELWVDPALHCASNITVGEKSAPAVHVVNETGRDISLHIGSGNTNRGIYDGELGTWIIYRNDSNTEIVDPLVVPSVEASDGFTSGGHDSIIGTMLSTNASDISLSAATNKNLCTLSISAGKWVIQGSSQLSSGTVGDTYQLSINSTSAIGSAIGGQTTTIKNSLHRLTAVRIVSLSSTTTYYLVGYTTSASVASAWLYAVRIA